MQAPPPADQGTPMERLARYFAQLLGRRDHLQIDESPERNRLVRVCVRDGWDAKGWAGQHKYLVWEDGSFTGMGSTTTEPSPDIELLPPGAAAGPPFAPGELGDVELKDMNPNEIGKELEDLTEHIKWGEPFFENYWVTPELEAQMKRIAREKKRVADEKYFGVLTKWMVIVNDCHTLVDDTLTECGLPPSKLGRMSGHSADRYAWFS